MKIEIKHGGKNSLKAAVGVRQATAHRYGDNVLLRVETDDKRQEAMMCTEDFGGEFAFIFTFFKCGDLPHDDRITEVVFRPDTEWERQLFNSSRIFQYPRTYGATAYVIPREPIDYEKMEELACYLDPDTAPYQAPTPEDRPCGST